MLILRSFRWPAMLAVLLLIGLLVGACRSDRPQATSPLTDNTAPASRAPELAVLPAVTATPALTPTPEPSPTVDMAALTEDATLPAGVSPFTGLLVDNPQRLERMPAAVNHSQDAERIGSVRSARLIDLEIPVLFDAFLVYSGAHGEVNRQIEASDFGDRTLSDDRNDPGFYRLEIAGRAYEHTLFTDSELLQEVAADKGWTAAPRYRGWQWSDRPPRLAQRARSLTIPYSAEYSDVSYQYDPALGAYLRSTLGEPHVDDLTGEQLAADNVVVLYVNHVPTLIVEDLLGSTSVQIQLWGEGRMQLFRDGTVQEGKWLRQQREDPLLFVDEAMQPLELKPGNVWIQIVPLDMEVASAP